MIITKTQTGNALSIALEGRLDTTSSPELEKELSLNDIEVLVLDFEKLDYISSAGLRVLLSAQKAMSKKEGTMKIIHANEMVREVFDVTGFSDILNIE